MNHKRFMKNESQLRAKIHKEEKKIQIDVDFREIDWFYLLLFKSFWIKCSPVQYEFQLFFFLRIDIFKQN